MEQSGFEIPIYGRVDLDGTHRVIFETTSKEIDYPTQESLFFKLTSSKGQCCVVVNALKVQAAQKRLLIDRYKLWHLGLKDGDMVTAQFFMPSVAEEIHYSSEHEFSKRDLVRLIGKPFVSNEKSALFSFSGDARPYTVQVCHPDQLVLVSGRTVLKEAKTKKEIFPLSYKDIGGLGSEIKLIRESIEYPFKHRDVFTHLGVKPPKGIILHGPPGTGKTLLAKALAHEIGANYYTISGPEIYSKWYGSSEQRLRNIFNEAVKNAPSIVVIDELDSLVPRRDTLHGDQEQRIVATFLTQMDGLKALKDVVVVGTTNRLNEIDPALRRNGRFEQEIYIGVPAHAGRTEVLEIHTSRMPLSSDVSLYKIAELANGFTGADLCSLCREAAYVALRRKISSADFESGQLDTHKDVTISHSDFLEAFKAVRPSASKEYTLDVPQTQWTDIGGLDGVKQILIENLQYAVKNKSAFEKVGIRAAGGILLYGPPGTGKTLVAKAVASECDVNFIGVKASDIRDKWIGESEEKIKNVFHKARLLAPCVIFFDEIDTILRTRGQDLSGVGDAIVNQILSEMDGLEEFGDIFIMGATNRIEAIDAAVLRPGRFDYHLEVPLPGLLEREAIFQIHLRNKPQEAILYSELADATNDYSGAKIAEVCRQAAWYALRASGYDADKVVITMSVLRQVIAEFDSAGTR